MTILEFLSEHSVDFLTTGHPHCRVGWANASCYQCTPEGSHYRLGINLTRGYANCWLCGKVDAVKALVHLTGRSWQECKAVLKSDYFHEENTKPLGKLVVPEGVSELLPAHKRYLKSRGFDPQEVISLWQVRGIGISCSLSWRLFIPIIEDKKTLSWTTRTIGTKEPRYINAKPSQEIISAKKLLYGYDHVRHGILVTEGPFDAIRIGMGAVATLGTSYSRTQVSKISRISKRVIVFDNEPNAQERARELVSLLEPYPGKTLRVEIDSPDPGSCSDREVKLLRRMIT
jgi:hypothetical protein